MAPKGPDIDVTAETLAAASASAGQAAHTLTEGAALRAAGAGDEHEVQTGQTFAHFRVERRLGKGGMGDVYLATDVALDRPVALKLLRKDVAADPAFRERFIREARAQARIQHPHVCHIYFIGEQDGQMFFAMEYIDGENLQQRLDRDQKLPLAEAVELCRMAALGLREAHKHGFIHRDVKPSNLLVDKNGVLKVVDFGIAKEARGPQGDVALTQQAGGGMVGTPLYMAPEQARGDPVDERADMYALGATLHHLVAGQPPFAGDTPLQIISKHLADPRPRLPAGGKARASRLDEVCDRMMAKRPADRFAGYQELIDALEQLSPSRTRPAGFWVRAFAITLDAFLVLLASIPFTLIGGPLGDLSFYVLDTLYNILANARWGRTLGKWVLEIEVVSLERPGPPSLSRSALRFLVQSGPQYLALATIKIIDRGDLVHGGMGVILIIALVVVGVLSPLWFGIAVSWADGKRAIWDKVARTQVRYRAR